MTHHRGTEDTESIDFSFAGACIPSWRGRPARHREPARSGEAGGYRQMKTTPSLSATTLNFELR